jgi:hypothetical protein
MRFRFFILFFLFSIFFCFRVEKTWPRARKDSTFFSLQENLKTKSPTKALLRSVALPGWGQFYNEKYFKSALIFGVETTYIILAADQWRKTSFHKKNFQNAFPYSPEQYYEFDLYKYHRDQRNLYLWVVTGIVFLSMFDAYVDAHLYDFDKIQMKDLEVFILPKDENPKEIKFCLSYKF